MNRSVQNWRVYKRGQSNATPSGEGDSLTFVNTYLAKTPEAAAEGVASGPGKFVVMDLNFTEVHQVYVTLSAKVIA